MANVEWMTTDSMAALLLGILVVAACYLWARRRPLTTQHRVPIRLDTLTSVRQALLTKDLTPIQRPHAKDFAADCDSGGEASDRLMREYLLEKSCKREEEGATRMLCERLGEPLDLGAPIFQWAADLVCGLALNQNLGSHLATVLRLWREQESVTSRFHSKERPGVQGLEKLVSFLEENISQHEKTLDIQRHRDFADYYLIRMKSVQEVGNTDSDTLTKSHLATCVLGLLVFGSESLAKSLELALVTLAERPFLQDRIQQELDKSTSEIEPTPLVQAVVMEAIRQAVPVPVVCLRNNSDALEIQGCSVPRGSCLEANLRSVLRDPELWQDPETFDPTRFLDQDGNINVKDAYVPFSLGISRCPCENLAKTAISSALTSILRQFRLARPSPTPSGVEEQPQDACAKICATRRQERG